MHFFTLWCIVKCKSCFAFRWVIFAMACCLSFICVLFVRECVTARIAASAAPATTSALAARSATVGLRASVEARLILVETIDIVHVVLHWKLTVEPLDRAVVSIAIVPEEQVWQLKSCSFVGVVLA